MALRQQVDLVGVDHLRSHAQTFVLSPRWRSVASLAKLSWNRIKFDDKNSSHIPRKRGVYAFIVSYEHSSFPPHGYVMYIGITGDNSANRTLRIRFGDYVREKKNGKRPKVHYMLNKYEQDLYFHYAAVDQRVNLKRLEEKLNDAFIPPVSANDFSASMRKKVKAFR